MSTKENFREFAPPMDMQPNPRPSDYSSLQTSLDTIVAVARLTYESFYIVDYHRMNFLYVSENPFFLCAHSVEEVKQMGFEFYYRHIAEEELPNFIRVHQACFSFIREVKIPDRSNYVSSINLHLQRPGSQSELLIHLQETPLVLSENGNVWLTLCQVSLPASGRNDETRLFSSRANRSWGFNKLDGRFHEDHSRLILSDIERQILHFASRGLSSKEIGAKLYRSAETVRSHKKELFDKLQVSNIAEAVGVAISRKLL